MKKTLIILGHNRTDSFCGAIAKTYAKSAKLAGSEIEMLNLGELKFDPILTDRNMKKESDIVKAQALILWADHLVFVYPNWWGAAPALLKGFIDRTFLSDFAFEYTKKGGYRKLLTGKTAHLIMTMDAPPWYYKIVCGNAWQSIMKKNVLGFCGIKPVKITMFGSVKQSDNNIRKQWLEKVENLAKK
ncbi:MAG: NAD(P)H-dependent oxidoreductase [Candidatus Marinimicrobia bacterium]|nr:NAD(P)H-dependent oxidoreductase [Candidatus Neomarinimicrobiota bacterium]